MKNIALLVMSLSVAMPALQGCATIVAAPEEAGPAATDLAFGIRTIGGVNGAGWADEARKRQVALVNIFNEADAGNVDVIVRAGLIKSGNQGRPGDRVGAHRGDFEQGRGHLLDRERVLAGGHRSSRG